MKDKYLRKLKVELVDGEFENPLNEQIRNPEQVHHIFRSIKDKAQETLLGFYLGDKLQARVYSVLSIGSNYTTLFASDEIFKHAYLTESKTFILVHNHANGDPTPTESDREAMKVIRHQTAVLRLTFLDFIIVGNDSYWSMFEAEEGSDYQQEESARHEDTDVTQKVIA